MFLKPTIMFLVQLLLFNIFLALIIAKFQSGEFEISYLSKSVVPLSYLLEINTDLVNFKFSGNVQINLSVIYATYVVKLHSKHLKITKCSLRKCNNDIIHFKLEIDIKRDLLLIIAEEKLIPDTYVLTIWFDGTLNENLVGFYRSSYVENGERKWMAVTQFQPNHAREAFPCFDEPQFRTPFTIRMGRLSHQVAFSNSEKESCNKGKNDLIWDVFEPTLNIPTYLVSFAVTELKYQKYKAYRTDITMYSRHNENARYFLEQAENIIAKIQSYTGYEYVLNKMDIVAVPDLKLGAMHNWRLLTFREMYIFLNEQSYAEIQKTMITLAASHIISCQWFDGAVSPHWWDSSWLVRGLAGYFEYFISAELEPSWNLEELFIFEEVQSSLWAEIEYQRAITSEIRKPLESHNLYNVVTWDKASCLFRMLEHIVTTVGFQCGINSYLKITHQSHRGIAEPRYLFEAFEIQTCYRPSLPPKKTLTEFLRTWTDNIGFPCINVIRDSHSDKIQFEQTTYKSSRAAPLPDQEWIVPITYTYKSQLKYETTPLLWSLGRVRVEALEVIPKSDWILCNIHQSGYYRVNYDVSNWMLLMKQLREDYDEIPVINRAQLLDDSFALSYDDMLSYAIPLQLAKYLEKENQILPWLPFVFHLDLLFKEFEETSDVKSIRAYIEQLISVPFNLHGFNIKQSDSHIFKVGYPSILSLLCKIGLPRCIDDALKEFENNIDDLNKIQPDLKGIVFCTALANSPEPENTWNSIWDLYRKTDSTYLKTLILSQLGCTKKERLLNRILIKLFDINDEDIRISEKNFAINSFFHWSISTTEFVKFFVRNILNLKTFEESTHRLLRSTLKKLTTVSLNYEQLNLLNLLNYYLESTEADSFKEHRVMVKRIYDDGIRLLEMKRFRREKIKLALENGQI